MELYQIISVQIKTNDSVSPSLIPTRSVFSLACAHAKVSSHTTQQSTHQKRDADTFFQKMHQKDHLALCPGLSKIIKVHYFFHRSDNARHQKKTFNSKVCSIVRSCQLTDAGFVLNNSLSLCLSYFSHTKNFFSDDVKWRNFRLDQNNTMSAANFAFLFFCCVTTPLSLHHSVCVRHHRVGASAVSAPFFQEARSLFNNRHPTCTVLVIMLSSICQFLIPSLLACDFSPHPVFALRPIIRFIHSNGAKHFR